jgi:hypothetical protein
MNTLRRNCRKKSLRRTRRYRGGERINPMRINNQRAALEGKKKANERYIAQLERKIGFLERSIERFNTNNLRNIHAPELTMKRAELKNLKERLAAEIKSNNSQQIQSLANNWNTIVTRNRGQTIYNK